MGKIKIQRRKTIVKFLVLICIFALYGCSAEMDKIENSDTGKENFLLLHKNYEYLKSNTSLFNKLNHLNTQKSTSKSKNIETKDFKIFTNNVTYTKRPDNSRESFTFYIQKKDFASNKIIDNLILARNLGDEEFKTYIITYYFPDGIASEHNNFTVTGFKEINSETFSITNLTSKTACENTYEYNWIELKHDCYSGAHSGEGQANQCDGQGNLPYSTYRIVANIKFGCWEGTPGGDPGNGGGGSGGPGGGGSGSGSGGGPPVDTGISLPPPCQSVDCDVPILANDINDLLGSKLGYEQLLFLQDNNDIAEKVKNFLDQNSTAEDKNFAIWTINYFTTNPNTSWDQFENWFMGTSEGQDGDYDTAYWENPNLTFPQQSLPTYNDYYNGMARFANGKLMTGADNVYGLVGGAVQQARIANPIRTANTCALKVSIALNRAGVIIPYIPGKTLEGSGEFAAKYFFLNAKSLNSWMRETFGTNPATTTTPSNGNHLSYTASDGGLNGVDFPDKLKGMNAIYSMITTDDYYNKTSTSGHSDLLFTDSNGLGECAYKCFFNLPIQRIDIWILN